MPVLTFTPKRKPPRRATAPRFYDSFAAEAKEVIENGYIFDFLPDFKAS